MDSAQRFLDGESASYRDQLRAAEKRRADLAEKYPDIVPKGDDNGTRLDQARGAVANLKLEMADAVAKRDALKKELASVPAVLTVDHGPQVVINGRLGPFEERLQELHRNLDGLLLKFTENHPDVRATRQSIAQLQSEAGKSGGGKGSSAGATGQIANGVYDQVKVKLVDAEAAVAALQRRVTEAEKDQAKIEKIAQSAPGILVLAQDLNRDYGILKRNYEELVSRREATAIANAADTKTEKIQFRIVDPPQVPVVPAAPNRPFLVSVVLLFGIGAGLAAPLLVMQLDRSFATLSQLRDLGIPILGHVSRLSLGTAQRHAALQLAGVTASALVLVAVYGTLLVLSIGPRSLGFS
jgi:polysaccharide chain length determinant protein (PEP-CTERM system associated)